jgi:serpin B
VGVCRPLGAGDAAKTEANVTEEAKATAEEAAMASDAGVPPGGATPDRDLAKAELLVLRGAADAVNAFSVDLFKRLAAAGGGNLVVSPYSLECALAAAAAGAEGATRDEMLRVLRLAPGHPVRDWLSPQAPLALLSARLVANPGIFASAARVIAAADLELNPGFAPAIGALYGTDVDVLDFADAAAARKSVNSWAAAKTDGAIPEAAKAAMAATAADI